MSFYCFSPSSTISTPSVITIPLPPPPNRYHRHRDHHPQHATIDDTDGSVGAEGGICGDEMRRDLRHPSNASVHTSESSVMTDGSNASTIDDDAATTPSSTFRQIPHRRPHSLSITNRLPHSSPSSPSSFSSTIDGTPKPAAFDTNTHPFGLCLPPARANGKTMRVEKGADLVDYKKASVAAEEAASFSVGLHSFDSLRDSHRYILTAIIHQSLFGSVRLAFDRKLMCLVCIKISSVEANSVGISRRGASVIENVRREAAIMRSLGHIIRDRREESLYRVGAPFITELIEERMDIRHHYLITPYHGAGDLFQFLLAVDQHKLTEKQARMQFRQLCLAVALLHENGIAHTDLSLENIAIAYDGTPRLIDFGTAAVHPLSNIYRQFKADGMSDEEIDSFRSSTAYSFMDYDDHSSNVSKVRCLIHPSNVRPGKIRYQSPELYGGESWDPMASDCFALGVILYCMLVGRPPFNAPGLIKFDHPNNVLSVDDRMIDPWFDDLYSGRWMNYFLHHPNPSVTKDVPYAALSTHAADLLNRIFKPQSIRLTIDEMLMHPWVNATDDQSINSSSSP